jgi:protein-S-isoprenylcysteine O-methyltransferase Ste14
MASASRLESVFRGFTLNTGAHALLIGVAWWQTTRSETLRAGEWGGWQTTTWIAAGLALPILHQAWVWLWWRTQYFLGIPERLFGLRPAFRIYGTGFALLAFVRIFTVTATGAANAGTLAISPRLSTGLFVLLFLPVVWLFYSIHRYFGFAHALGGDHFFEEHRTQGICREGIFRYVPNAMYTVGFLALWAIAIGYRSQAALLVAAFNHASIWVHYFALEQPDMREIYSDS